MECHRFGLDNPSQVPHSGDMNTEPIFGPTKSGAILAELVAPDKRLARKLRAFYSESMTCFRALTSVSSIRTRRILRDAYLHDRCGQLGWDILGGENGTEEIHQRMSYVLKQGSRYLL